MNARQMIYLTDHYLNYLYQNDLYLSVAYLNDLYFYNLHISYLAESKEDIKSTTLQKRINLHQSNKDLLQTNDPQIVQPDKKILKPKPIPSRDGRARGHAPSSRGIPYGNAEC